MNPTQIAGYANAVLALVQVGEVAVAGIAAAAKSIASAFGRTLTQAELAAIVASISADASMRELLANLDTGKKS